MEQFTEHLKKLRARIDWLDVEIAVLLNERMRATDHIGKSKQLAHEEVVDNERENYVLARVKKITNHPVLRASIDHIYHEVIEQSKVAQIFLQHTDLEFRRIGLIGMGLIGGSICKAVKTKDPEIKINTLKRHSENQKLAREEAWIDNEYNSLADLVEFSDIIILASPIATVVEFAREINRLPHYKQLVVIDVSSVKEEIVHIFAGLTNKSIEFVGTHPMAGKERGGFAHSEPTLFVNKPWIITPHHKNRSETLDAVNELILFCGAIPIVLNADTHDHQVALISHLPALLARSYFSFVSDTAPESLAVAGPGFKSFTRLAHDNSAMHAEIYRSNEKLIQHYLKLWLEHLTTKRS